MSATCNAFGRLRSLVLMTGVAAVLGSFAAGAAAQDKSGTPFGRPPLLAGNRQIAGRGQLATSAAAKSTVLHSLAIPTVERPASAARRTTDRPATGTLRAAVLLMTLFLAAIAATITTRFADSGYFAKRPVLKIVP